MVFASHSFIFFLFFCIATFYFASRINGGLGKFVIILFSLIFYAYWRPVYVLLLLGSTLGNFWLAGQILRARERRPKILLVVVGITANLLTLGYFKYFAFLVSSLNLVVEHPLPVPDIVLPIGISFFTFQQVGFLVDFYRGKIARPKFPDYLFIISFFPHSIAGPIVRLGELLPQMTGRRDWKLRADQLAIGFAIFAIGLFKKSVLVDPVVPYIDAIYRTAAIGDPVGFVDGWVAGVSYGFQIYFDFSGYSDMAIGLSYIFGVKLPVNFFSPYRSVSIREFWRRWHISLSRFLRDYLFIPLGGSRHGLPRTIAALTVTMALGGLWHGAAWTFVAWGLLHGIFLSINHVWRSFVPKRELKSVARAISRTFSVAVTFLAVSVAWIFFRAGDFASALRLIEGMAGLNGWHSVASSKIISMLPLYFVIVWAMPNTLQIFRKFSPALHAEDYASPADDGLIERGLSFNFSARWAVAAAFIFVFAWLAVSNLSPFIYSQF